MTPLANFAAPVTRHVRKLLIRRKHRQPQGLPGVVPIAQAIGRKRNRTTHVELWYAHGSLDGSG